MPFVHDGVRGIADFLVRVDDRSGLVSYEPVDAKLARSRPSPATYSNSASTPRRSPSADRAAPRHVHLWLGSGEQETLRASHFLPYWNAVRGRSLKALLTRGPDEPATAPEPCASLRILRVRRRVRSPVAGGGFAGLCGGHPASRPDNSRRRALRRWRLWPSARRIESDPAPIASSASSSRRRSRSQARTEPRSASSVPIIEPRRDPLGPGIRAPPEPDDGDVFLDFEGDPFWRADAGLFFLFGLIDRGADGELACTGVLGARPRQRRQRPRESSSSTCGPPGDLPGHARLPLQPHGAVGARAPGCRPRCRRGGTWPKSSRRDSSSTSTASCAMPSRSERSRTG